MTIAQDRHAAHAAVLEQAADTRMPAAPLTEADPGLTVADAYGIQRLGIERRCAAGAHVRGHKVGLTSRPMQELLGVDEPDFGVLLDEMILDGGSTLPAGRLIQPKAEAEIAFLLSADLQGPGVTTAQARAAIGWALPSIEVIDSRIADWRIALVDTIADNASSGLAVLGSRLTPLAGLDLETLGVVVTRNGDVVETGAGAAALGDPARCVAWLANRLSGFGDHLRAGDVVLPGALHRAIDLQPGDVVRAEFAGLGAVACRVPIDHEEN